MTLTSHVSTIAHYTGNAVLTDFAIPFAFLKEEHVDVYLDDVLQDPSTYSITNCQERPGNNGCAEGSTLVFPTAPATAVKIAIIRCTPITNESDWRTTLKFQAEVKERALDKLTMILQELNDRSGSAVRVASSGPKFIGGGPGLTFRKLVDVRPAQIMTNLGSGRYTFLFVGYDKTGSKCFGTYDSDANYAYENNLCATVPTFYTNVRNYVLMYTFQTGGTFYYRFSSGSSCLYGSACGGPWSPAPPYLPNGDIGPDTEGGGEGGGDTGGPETEWYQYARCSDPATGIGWHNELGSEFYYDIMKRTGTGRPICYQRMSAVPIVSVNPPGDIIQDVFWAPINSCDQDVCEDCINCTCGASGPVATITYDYCGGGVITPDNFGCSATATSATATLTRVGGTGCVYEGDVGLSIGPPLINGWSIRVECDEVNGLWKVSAVASDNCWGYQGDFGTGGTLILKPELNCVANKPAGTVYFAVASANSLTMPVEPHRCGTLTVVLS